MLQIKTVTSKVDKRRFVDFVYRVYQGNSCFCDTQVHALRNFLYKKDCFAKECRVRPVVVEKNGSIVCQALLVCHSGLAVLQIAFFESLPSQEKAVQLLLSEARREARMLGVEKIIAGMNGHVSYGVGFLMSEYDKPSSFDGRYSPPYYHHYFEGIAECRPTLSTYHFKTENAQPSVKAFKRIRKSIQFRGMDLRRFHEEMLLFGSLCNRCLADTYLYFDRAPLAMYEMLRPLRFLLRPEHLIFATLDGHEIGFIFCPPDYNQVLRRGCRNSMLWVAWNCLARRSEITRRKVNVLGVLPQHRHSGVSLGLIWEAGRHWDMYSSGGETNFVWDDNQKSSRLCRRTTDGVFRTYCVYEFSAKE